jgi:hypothetical protein
LLALLPVLAVFTALPAYAELSSIVVEVMFPKLVETQKVYFVNVNARGFDELGIETEPLRKYLILEAMRAFPSKMIVDCIGAHFESAFYEASCRPPEGEKMIGIYLYPWVVRQGSGVAYHIKLNVGVFLGPSALDEFMTVYENAALGYAPPERLDAILKANLAKWFDEVVYGYRWAQEEFMEPSGP